MYTNTSVRVEFWEIKDLYPDFLAGLLTNYVSFQGTLLMTISTRSVRINALQGSIVGVIHTFLADNETIE